MFPHKLVSALPFLAMAPRLNPVVCHDKPHSSFVECAKVMYSAVHSAGLNWTSSARSLSRSGGSWIGYRMAMRGGEEQAPMIADDLRMIKESLLTLLFPPLCSFCDATGAQRVTAICASCREALRPVPSPVCSRCGLPFAGLSEDRPGFCGRCLTNPPPYTRARYGFLYTGGLKEGIVRFKYAGRLYLSVTLGNLLFDAFTRHFSVRDFDLIVPVPDSSEQARCPWVQSGSDLGGKAVRRHGNSRGPDLFREDSGHATAGRSAASRAAEESQRLLWSHRTGLRFFADASS